MATQTAHGFPYPVGTDRVMDGDNAMQALAEKIDTHRTTPPRARRAASALQAIPHNVETTVNLGTVSYDTDTMAAVANTITIKTAGWYRFAAHCPYAANGTGFRVVFIKGGGAIGLVAANTGSTPLAGIVHCLDVVSEPILCAVNDAFFMTTTQQSGGGALNTTAYPSAASWPSLSAEFVWFA